MGAFYRLLAGRDIGQSAAVLITGKDESNTALFAPRTLMIKGMSCLNFPHTVILMLSNASVCMREMGWVSTTQPLAVQVGIEMIKQGDNAIDAVIAAAITLTVAAPCAATRSRWFGLKGNGMAWTPVAMRRRDEITRQAQPPQYAEPQSSGTVYLACADGEGNITWCRSFRVHTTVLARVLCPLAVALLYKTAARKSAWSRRMPTVYGRGKNLSHDYSRFYQ